MPGEIVKSWSGEMKENKVFANKSYSEVMQDVE